MELHTVSTPFSHPIKRLANATETEYNESLDGIFLCQSDRYSAGEFNRRKKQKHGPDVRGNMPFLDVIHGERTFELGAHLSNDKLQYIGELIVCIFIALMVAVTDMTRVINSSENICLQYTLLQFTGLATSKRLL